MDDVVARRFSAAAPRYDRGARIQERAAEALDVWLADRGLSPPARIVEIGCGTGFLTARLAARFPRASICATDLAPAMLARCRDKLDDRPNVAFRLDDGRSARFHPAPDWIVSAMCFQWFDPLLPVLEHHFAQCRTLAFSVLLDGSFSEWRAAHTRTGQPLGLRRLPAYDELERRCRSFDATVHARRMSLSERYATGLAFARALKTIGAGEPRPRPRPANLRPVLEALKRGIDANYEIGFFCITREAGAGAPTTEDAP